MKIAQLYEFVELYKKIVRTFPANIEYLYDMPLLKNISESNAQSNINLFNYESFFFQFRTFENKYFLLSIETVCPECTLLHQFDKDVISFC